MMKGKIHRYIFKIGLLGICFVILGASCKSVTETAAPSVVIATSTISSSIRETYTNSTTPTETSSPNPTITLPLASRTATATYTRTPIPTTALPSPTMGPTLTYDERYDFFVNMLDTNGGCQLPCFWGFNPGEARWDEVRNKILNLGLHIYEEEGGDTFDIEYQNPQVSFSWAVSMYVKNGIVDVITNQVVIHDKSPLMVQYKEPFSLRSILLTHGIPDRIWMGLNVGGEVSDPQKTDNDLYLFYDKRGILIHYFGGATKMNDTYESCPNYFDKQTHKIIWSTMDLQSPQSDTPLEDIHPPVVLNGVLLKPVTYPIEEATGLSVEEFYNLITQEGDAACFSTPRNIWP